MATTTRTEKKPATAAARKPINNNMNFFILCWNKQQKGIKNICKNFDKISLYDSIFFLFLFGRKILWFPFHECNIFFGYRFFLCVPSLSVLGFFRRNKIYLVWNRFWSDIILFIIKNVLVKVDWGWYLDGWLEPLLFLRFFSLFSFGDKIVNGLKNCYERLAVKMK